jgi:putative toxin-antitoxin system antitoxin component (TIGR02293 family)
MAKVGKKRGLAQAPAPHYESGSKAVAGQRVFEAWLSPEVAPRLALVEQIREGFPFALVGALAKEAGIGLDELMEFGVIPRRTWTHSKRNQRFTPTQSARLARFFRILHRARETFGADETAMRWLKHGTKPLQGTAPVDLLDTEEGARLVEDLLTRIDHGIAT